MNVQNSYTEPAEAGGFFGVISRKQTYLNAAYLFLSLPFGIFYFSFLISGFSVGLGLSIIVVGIFILLLMMAATRGLSLWERQLAIWLLDARLSALTPKPVLWNHPWEAFKILLTDSTTWKGLLFLMIKFPLGIITFVVTIVFTAVSLSLIFTPLFYRYVPVDVYLWRVTRAEEALLCLAVGLFLGIVTLYIINALAAVWRALSEVLLGGGSPVQGQPLRQGPVIIP